jgi:hypothetical protein
VSKGARPKDRSKEGYADLEQLFHLRNPALVLKEQDHVVLGLDAGIVMGEEHFFATNYGTKKKKGK